MNLDQQAAEALQGQRDHVIASMNVDRSGWTRRQWIDDAERLMSDLDGSIVALVNGHVIALLDEVEALGDRVSASGLEFDDLVRAVLNSRYQWIRLDDAVDMATNTARNLVDAGATVVVINGCGVDVHQSPSAMRRLVEQRGLLKDEAEHDPGRPVPTPPRGATATGLKAVVDALQLIDRHGCTNYTGRRCSEDWSGRRRGGPDEASSWCGACVARDALDRLAEDSPAVTG